MDYQVVVPEKEYWNLEELIKNIELARINAYKQLSLIRLRHGEGNYLNERLPKCEVEIIYKANKPVLRLLYEGSLPRYIKGQIYSQEIRDYYLLSTLQAIEDKKITLTFEESIVWIRHHFNSNIIRDIDNRNRKYLIDAARHARILLDDRRQLLSIYESAIDSKKEQVEVLVSDPETMANIIFEDIKSVSN